LTGLMGGCAGTGLADFSTAVGKSHHLRSRKLHAVAPKLAEGFLALPRRMQQNCAAVVMNSP
jgi:hypothetical protein